MTSPAAPLFDAHVHFWDPARLRYPWLADLPALQRAFHPSDHRAAAGDAPVEGVLFVEANPRPDQGAAEARWVAELAQDDPRIRGIVAFVDLTDRAGVGAALDELAGIPLVRGVRHNIQGNPPGFCLQPAFVDGVREVGRRGLVFDLCATHHQLAEVVELVRRCPDTRFVLDHCGKPAVALGLLDPWRAHLEELAAGERVCCKLSGLLTEADPAGWSDQALLPYAEHVVRCFGAGRILFGSDWPVVTLAGDFGDWYHFTRRFTRDWSPAETRALFHDNARRVYGLQRA